MTITKTQNGDTVNFALEGRLDTVTSPELEASLNGVLSDASVKNITMDFASLEYISSAGLRVLLTVQKAMNAKSGTFTISNVSEDVMLVLEITGFADILTIA